MRARPIRRRRRDGLVEIRRARARDVVLTFDSFVLLALLAGWFFFSVLLVMTLIFAPAFLGLAAWGVLLLVVDQKRTRPAHLVPAAAEPPPGSAA